MHDTVASNEPVNALIFVVVTLAGAFVIFLFLSRTRRGDARRAERQRAAEEEDRLRREELRQLNLERRIEHAERIASRSAGTPARRQAAAAPARHAASKETGPDVSNPLHPLHPMSPLNPLSPAYDDGEPVRRHDHATSPGYADHGSSHGHGSSGSSSGGSSSSSYDAGSSHDYGSSTSGGFD